MADVLLARKRGKQNVRKSKPELAEYPRPGLFSHSVADLYQQAVTRCVMKL